MRSSFAKQNNTKVVLYAVLLAVVCIIGYIVVQDIEVPTKHTVQEISVSLEK